MARLVEALSDDELVARARDGERDAYRVLVQRYQGRAFALAYEILRNREDAEDVVQDGFVKAFVSLQSFKGDSAFSTWLYRIVYNVALDLKRKLKRRGGDAVEFDEFEVAGLEAVQGAPAAPDGPQTALLRRERLLQIQTALRALSDEHRAVILLRELEGLSYEEISSVTGVSLGTVMSRLHYARKRLQAVLRDDEDLPEGGGEARPEEEIRSDVASIPPRPADSRGKRNTGGLNLSRCSDVERLLLGRWLFAGVCLSRA